ncbi:MAG: NAD(P)-dependent oxidoreductase [Schwartzia sp.]|nr:NAD(P)-dependent oxidoreductase [Schwartzia sp. (in: firmicutes)]MBR1760095.1 NAD(P)-dependent oxidoreductase [Schwartzia sp. (in: firmicutes)]MBR1885708.1 NAD(P)-dependent oxidoreductase [Schwartzia sp. (in: firmicutes)]
MAIHVIREARRCLQCSEPSCRFNGCPLQTNIPEMIRLFLEGNMSEAGTMLFDHNPMSVFCSLVCDHERQCEGNCIQGKQSGSPVQISSIEHYISDAYLDRLVLTKEPDKGQKVAVIGSGPAGLTVAVRLARQGYAVTVFDRKDRIGGMLRYGIPEFRLPKKLLDRYEKKLRDLGVHIRPNTTIGGALHIDDLFDDGYEAVFIGVGTWRARRLGVKGESLGNVHYAVDYLQNPDAYELGDTVAIIGAGNSAMDVARTAVRHNSRYVTIYARDNTVTASQRELEYTMADGVEIAYGMETLGITDEGPIFAKRIYNEEGKVVGREEPQLSPTDSVIIAVSQRAKDKLSSTTIGLLSNERGLLEVDEGGRTTRAGVFAGGDVTLGPWNVVQAVKSASHVADAMIDYLKEKAREK